MKKQKKILFFINGTLPTEKELEFSKTCVDKVCFRNIQFLDNNGCIESCDFMLGEIPAKYKKAGIPIYGKQEKKPEIKELEIKKDDEKKSEPPTWKPQA